MDAGPVTPAWQVLAFGVAGGLALFLYGIACMTDALKSAAGPRLKQTLERMTTDRFRGVLAGAGITAIIQSSSVTTVLLVGFVSAGLMTFPQTLGVILGANIGSTVTAQIIAFKVTKAALLFVALGYLGIALCKRSWIRDYGGALFALGLVFLGMNIMGEATLPLRAHQPFIQTLEGLDNPVLGVLTGALVTAVLQSSAATAGIIVVLASQGLIHIEAGIALILGANVGTCVTALIAAIGKPRPALQAACAHIIFNLAGAALWIAFIGNLAHTVYALSPGDMARQVANAHTIFNTVNALLFIGLTVPLARLVQWLIPDRESKALFKGIELNDYYLRHKPLALDLARRAVIGLGNDTLDMLDGALHTALSGTRENLKALRNKDMRIDSRHRNILDFLSGLGRENLDEAAYTNLRHLVEIANTFENSGDLVSTNLVEAAHHRCTGGWSASANTRKQLSTLFDAVRAANRNALTAFENNDTALARSVCQSKSDYRQKSADTRLRLAQRLSAAEPNRIPLFRFESELIEVARNLHRNARHIARQVERIDKDNPSPPHGHPGFSADGPEAHPYPMH